MKKVLIISFFFNKKEEIGSIRLRGLAEFLPKFDWEPTILTIKINNETESNFRTVETKYSDLVANWESKFKFSSENIKLKSKKNSKSFTGILTKAWLEIFTYPDPEKNWFKPAVEASSNLLENEHFDAILSSSSPVTCHLIANELKKRYKIPWIADLRDLWTQNPYFNHTFGRTILEKKLELKTLRNADAITTTTEYFKRDLQELHKKNEVYTILNGFHPINKIQDIPMINKFNIVYTGRLYYGKRDPEPLFLALNELIKEGDINTEDVKIEFYGPDGDWLLGDVKKYQLEKMVEICGILPRDKILQKQRKSQLLLLLAWDNPQEKGVIPGKVFEYLAAKRPILFIGNSEGLVKKLIESTNAGITASNTKDIKDTILRFYNEFKSKGEVKYNGINDEIDKYNQVNMAKKFSKVLNRITDNF